MEKSHGRIEKRTLTTTTNIIDSGYLNWPGAGQLIRLERETKTGGKTRKSVTYAITSLTRKEATRLIVSGFFQQIFDRITIESVREALGQAILRRVREYL